ncbi:hypothetical protein IFM61606_06192 [Aspergillus udagawae]|uniref:Nudix hydrolase domain-containing protein n=1 Tax=Aspergillus udagawae TaxID=91492 RepID=A0ABQ1B3S3_9EURO|nr:hypothetical protein IFM51744_07393 [Aspergillus udagawae]GFF93136.1 hypothetical protein IFM53868_07086 [Aspergillus udagawae]GFG09362.1 hypothetical protein IFM5058_04384 [Aspergillus udagawae]GFG26220.1 hypothetical protein IFM61606_06192 [Aspergillus udagawae]
MNGEGFEFSPQLAKFNVPIAEFFASNPQYTEFITGAYIFSNGTDGGVDIQTFTRTNSEPRVLLLQRSLTDDYGGCWEGPGGSCEHTDSTLLSALVREVFEESGLHVSRVLDLVAVEDWDSGYTAQGKAKKAVKYSFLVDVHERALRAQQGASGWEQQVTIAPEEHEQFQWGTEEQVRKGTETQEERFRFCGEEGSNFLKAFEAFRRLL